MSMLSGMAKSPALKFLYGGDIRRMKEPL